MIGMIMWLCAGLAMAGTLLIPFLPVGSKRR
jgi:hypothetical protein